MNKLSNAIVPVSCVQLNSTLYVDVLRDIAEHNNLA